LNNARPFQSSILVSTYLTHHSICASSFIVSEFYIWIPILDQLFEALVLPPDWAFGCAAGPEGVLADIRNILALN
jgi:hypothetical protein